ncbi:MAG TPA: hypothetical protein VG273_09490 [Bryobacteraceae bacterium]|jgi:hypothetical protein|nr:hypothetical protein [Bryobacteraceae bacterium]
MRTRVLVLATALEMAGALFGQSGAYKAPRLADGRPDLQGTYDLATMTPVERPKGQSATLSKEQASKAEAAVAERSKRADEPISGDRGAPPVGGIGIGLGGGPGVGGYNYGWLDPGNKFTVVDGQIRSSLVIDPQDGHLPPYTAEAQKRIARQGAQPTSDASESNAPGLETVNGAYDDPERRPLGERCLLGFGSTSGPPALPDYFYNNLHQIVQTRDTVLILTEMVHDVRIVRMDAPHLPQTIRKWMGDSVGHWDGETLVVDTTNFTDKTHFRGSTENLHVVERFTRVGPRSIIYRFTVDDPATWAKPWTGEFTWPLTDSHIYEYACHEANYALADILSGARFREKEAAGKSGK